jgi:hypothetical protein
VSISPARPRKRWWLRILITVVVLLGVLIAVDRVAVAAAESAVGQTVQNSQHLASRPSVDIAGFPFLTQLASGNFDKITLSDSGVVIGEFGHSVRLAHLTVTLHHVHVARSLKSGTSDSGTADALITYADLGSTLGVKLHYAGSGRVTANASVLIGSNTITGDVTATPHLSGQRLEFLSPKVTVGGVTAPAAVSDAIGNAFGAPIALDRLPYGLSVQRLVADAQGLHITLAGQQLTFHR